MASSKISELVDGGSFLPGDDTIIVRNGANFKVDPTINAVNAWVNFNGTGTVAIRESYNVSSITDNGTGDYTVNFTNALTDANYAVSGSAGQRGTFLFLNATDDAANTVNSLLIYIRSGSGTFFDLSTVSVVVIR